MGYYIRITYKSSTLSKEWTFDLNRQIRSTFVVSLQDVIQLAVMKDKPEVGGYTKKPSVTQRQADLPWAGPGQHSDPGSHSANLTQKAINTGPDPYIHTLSQTYSSHNKPLYRSYGC